jgi:hypothetical protein
MGARGEHGVHHWRGGRAPGGRPPDQPLWGPFPIRTLGGGPGRSDRAVAPFETRADVARHAGSLVEEFHHTGTAPHLELRRDERLGPRIGVAGDFHGSLHVDAGALPLSVGIGLGREGLQGGAVAGLKEALSGAG